jgi:hypothetical protein
MTPSKSQTSTVYVTTPHHTHTTSHTHHTHTSHTHHTHHTHTGVGGAATTDAGVAGRVCAL